MPSGTAIRPGDILKMRNGKTIEVMNTDAEGQVDYGRCTWLMLVRVSRT